MASMPETMENVENEPLLSNLIACVRSKQEFSTEEHKFLPLLKGDSCVAVLAISSSISDESKKAVLKVLTIISKGNSSESTSFGMVAFLIGLSWFRHRENRRLFSKGDLFSKASDE